MVVFRNSLSLCFSTIVHVVESIYIIHDLFLFLITKVKPRNLIYNQFENLFFQSKCYHLLRLSSISFSGGFLPSFSCLHFYRWAEIDPSIPLLKSQGRRWGAHLQDWLQASFMLGSSYIPTEDNLHRNKTENQSGSSGSNVLKVPKFQSSKVPKVQSSKDLFKAPKL